MNLCIDIGNTLIKTAVFSGSVIICKKQWHEMGSEEIEMLKSSHPEIHNVIICSVKPENRGLINILESNFEYLLIFDQGTSIPLENLYKTKNTLGKDRLAAVTAANNIYPGRNVFVVDVGTAITYDMVDEFNRYIGGNISPGLALRFRALHEYTGKLPLVKPKNGIQFLANNTEDAIAAGVQNGIIFEMESYICKMKEQFRDMITIFTGGDAKFFDKKIKSPIFVNPDLILTGLNRILTYNVEKK